MDVHDLAQAALAALEVESERNQRLRASRLAGLGQGGLEEDLWMAAGERSRRRAQALFKAGAKGSALFGAAFDCSRARKSSEDRWPITAFERAALLANFAFLEAAQGAGADPFEGWEEMSEGPWNFGDVGHDKQARWMAKACEAPLSAHGAKAALDWMRGAGLSRASCSAEPGFCWDVADALAASLGGQGVWAGQERLRDQAFATLREAVSTWERSGARRKGSPRPLALARKLSQMAWAGAGEAWWADAALGPGPAQALASCCAGSAPAWIATSRIPWMRDRKLGVQWSEAAQSWSALEPQMPARAPFALVCAVWGSLELAKAWRASQSEELASPEARALAAWLWAADLDPKGCAGLRALGFKLADLDGEALRRGWQTAPRMRTLASRAKGLSPWAHACLEKAAALGRLEPELWDDESLADVEGECPEVAAGARRRLLGASAKPAKRAGRSRL